MTYTINKSDGTLISALEEQSTDTSSTSLTLVGAGVLNYGEVTAENFVHLLENFSNTVAPANPIAGQFWFHKGTKQIKVWDGTVWKRVMSGSDDANTIPGLTIGSGLTMASNVLSANVRSVAGRTGDVVLANSDVAGSAPLASPALTGIPTAPTASANSNSTQVATTAFVRNQIQLDTTNYGQGNGLEVYGNNLRVVGTQYRIAVSAAGVDISPYYAGQSSINTVGTINTGKWRGDSVEVAFGGTGGNSPATARANLNALEYNALAHSLKSLSYSGLLVNNNGNAYARAIVSGTPSKLTVTNGDGVAGNITISLVGEGTDQPVAIAGGGTGATTKSAAFNALSPATTAGDLIFFNGTNHTRLAGKGDALPYYLMSGVNDANPRWTNTISASQLNGQAASYYLNRVNHTGTNNADLLQNHDAAYFLNRANHTGSIDLTTIMTMGNNNLAAQGDGSSNYYRFANGLTVQWGKYNGYFETETSYTITYPVAFTSCYWANCTVKAVASKYSDWFTLISNISNTSLTVFNSHAGDWKGSANNGWYWIAIGYIA